MPIALGRRIRKRRQMLSLTLQQLGDASGISVGYLSQVERDNAVPTLGTLANIAAALDVAIDHFIATPRQADSVTRNDTRARFAVDGTSIAYEQIGAEFPGHELTSFILNVPVGYQSETVQHEGEELIYVLEGSIRQMVAGQEFVLNAGDSIHYLGQNPHSWSNASDRVARLLWTGKMLHGATVTAHRPGATGRITVPEGAAPKRKRSPARPEAAVAPPAAPPSEDREKMRPREDANGTSNRE